MGAELGLDDVAATSDLAYRQLGVMEAKLRILADDLARERRRVEFYRVRIDALEHAQRHMRDPERKMVCDILANGALSESPWLTRHAGINPMPIKD